MRGADLEEILRRDKFTSNPHNLSQILNTQQFCVHREPCSATANTLSKSGRLVFCALYKTGVGKKVANTTPQDSKFNNRFRLRRGRNSRRRNKVTPFHNQRSSGPAS